MLNLVEWLGSNTEFGMRSVNLHEAKTHLSELVGAAAAGEEIIIAKAGKHWPAWSLWKNLSRASRASRQAG